MSTGRPAWRQVTVVVRPFRAEAVLQAITDKLGPEGLSGCVVREVKGYSRQKGYLDRYLGGEYSMAFLPKVEISLAVPADWVDEISARAVRAARTGRIGDGKVFVVPTIWEGEF
ncbi:MAG: P-II family nitrogen regulator [Planctomycetes bacterium]|nr:P-II family nitrogen regulator [Planctomycetota bacterium]